MGVEEGLGVVRWPKVLVPIIYEVHKYLTPALNDVAFSHFGLAPKEH